MEYSIADLAKEFETTPRTLRFYELKGILKPQRQGVSRVYSDRDRVRLTLALRGRRIGLSLEEVKEIIDMHDPRQPDDVRQSVRLLHKIHEHREELISKMIDIGNVLNQMHEVERRVLDALAKRPNARINQLPLDLI